jgi:hypothetical protein
MRNQTPLAPGEPAFDVTIHIVLNDFGPLGRAYCETDETEADEATIVENILSGQYSCPLWVVALNTAEGWARDVTGHRTGRGEPCAARKPLNREIRARVFGEGSWCGCTRCVPLRFAQTRCPAMARSSLVI